MEGLVYDEALHRYTFHYFEFFTFPFCHHLVQTIVYVLIIAKVDREGGIVTFP